MHARSIAPSFLVAAFAAVAAAPAAAQSAQILGKNDAAYARLLYERGYIDLAERLCDVITKSGNPGPDEKIGVEALHLDLRLNLARTEPDLLKRKDAIKKILEDKNELIRQYRGRKEADEATATLPDVYRLLGETLSAAIQKEKDVKVVAELQNEGQKTYAQAEEALQARIKSLEEDHSAPAAEQQYMSSLYNLPRTYYYHSLLFPAGEWKKKDLLEKAIEGFSVFGLDYSDTFFNYEGLVFMGLCDKDLGNLENALTSFNDAIALREQWELDPKGYYAMPAQAADIVSSAVLQKVLLQAEMKDYSGAAATAKDFLDKTPNPLDASQGLAVLGALADAQIAAGDMKAANETAQMLVDADERGPWGAKGRDIQSKSLSGGSSLSAGETLKIAQSLAAKGDIARALQICHQAIQGARGTDKEPAIATEAYLLIGGLFAQRGWNHEASVAFDAALDRYPNAEKAAEAAYQSLQSYVRLNGEEKRATYKKRIDERMKTLATRYASHPRAAYAQLVEGQQLEAEKSYLKAAELYSKVTPGSPSYLEALFRTGNCYFLQARALFLEKKNDEAKTYVGQAETLLKKSITELDTAAKNTMELETQARYERLNFQARSALAELFLLAGVNRPAEVVGVLEGADDLARGDGEKLAAVWSQRIRALQAQGKLDEAVALLDSLAKKNPQSRAIGPAAGLIARELDRRSVELRDKEKKVRDADEMQKRAAQYYSMSGRALLASDVIKASEVEIIANRLFALGLHLNNVPESQDTFVGWSPKQNKDEALWTQAAELFAAALRVSPSYRTTITLGRVQGFLGHWVDAAGTYGQLFDQEALYDRDTKKLNNALLRSKPELLVAYLEWGVAEHEAALIDNDADRFARASNIFEVMCKNLEVNSKTWWPAKYRQIRCSYDQGRYDTAQVLMNDVIRSTPDLGGGDKQLKEAFEKLKTDISTKVFPKNKPQ